MPITNPAAQVFRDYATDGVPASGVHNPDKSEVRQWGTEVENEIAAGTVPAEREIIAGTGLTGGGDLSADRTLAIDAATPAEYRSAAADKVLTPDEVWDAAALAVLTDAATIAVDFSAGFNFGGASNAPLALGGNRTLGAPSNLKTGQAGILWFGASVSTRTLTLNAAWVLCTGVETGPYSITTAQELGVAYVVRGSVVRVTAILRQG